MKEYRRAYLGGTFDLAHYGHYRLFRYAKSIADIVVVSVNNDDFVTRYKGKSPILTLSQRMDFVAGFRDVDIVIVNTGSEDSIPAILRVRPDVIVHGDDWVGESLMKQMGITQQFLEEHNIVMEYPPYTEGVSSTMIRIIR